MVVSFLRVAACLADVADAFGEARPVVLARGLTHQPEEYVRGRGVGVFERQALPVGESPEPEYAVGSQAETLVVDHASSGSSRVCGRYRDYQSPG